MSHLEGVRLIRSTKRLGVAGCRTLGAARAAGEVLVFMDSHCECQKGWLEPLLERLAQDRYLLKRKERLQIIYTEATSLFVWCCSAEPLENRGMIKSSELSDVLTR